MRIALVFAHSELSDLKYADDAVLLSGGPGNLEAFLDRFDDSLAMLGVFVTLNM